MNYLYILAGLLVAIGLYLHFTLPTEQDPVKFQEAAISRKRWGMVLLIGGAVIAAYGYFTKSKKANMFGSKKKSDKKCWHLIEKGNGYSDWKEMSHLNSQQKCDTACKSNDSCMIYSYHKDRPKV